MNEPCIGAICTSRAGHDKGRAFVIVGVYDENHVLLSDGETRKLERPKKKKLMHLHIEPQRAEEIAAARRGRGPAGRAGEESALSARLQRGCKQIGGIACLNRTLLK